MPEFKVTYFDRKGKKKKENFIAFNKEELVTMMRENELTILEIHEKGEKKGFFFRDMLRGLNRINISGADNVFQAAGFNDRRGAAYIPVA